MASLSTPFATKNGSQDALSFIQTPSSASEAPNTSNKRQLSGFLFTNLSLEDDFLPASPSIDNFLMSWTQNNNNNTGTDDIPNGGSRLSGSLHMSDSFDLSWLNTSENTKEGRSQGSNKKSCPSLNSLTSVPPTPAPSLDPLYHTPAAPVSALPSDVSPVDFAAFHLQYCNTAMMHAANAAAAGDVLAAYCTQQASDTYLQFQHAMMMHAITNSSNIQTPSSISSMDAIAQWNQQKKAMEALIAPTPQQRQCPLYPSTTTNTTNHLGIAPMHILPTIPQVNVSKPPQPLLCLTPPTPITFAAPRKAA